MSLRYFKPPEFACPCCGKNNMDPDFLRQLDAARDWAQVPFRITSACRCEKHNAEVGGEPKSRHMAGQAVDIAFTDQAMLGRIIAALLRVGLTSMAASKPKNFIHVDTYKGFWFGLY